MSRISKRPRIDDDDHEHDESDGDSPSVDRVVGAASRAEADDDAAVRELRSLLRIDRNNLDDEVVAFSDIYYRVSEAHVSAVAARDDLKEQVDRLYAELDPVKRDVLRAREERDTNEKTRALILQDQKYIDINDRLRRATARASKLSVLKDAHYQRSYMLRALVDLHVSGYFASDPGRGSDRRGRREENSPRR